MGILNMVLGLKDIDVKGNQVVRTLKKNFKEGSFKINATRRDIKKIKYK